MSSFLQSPSTENDTQATRESDEGHLVSAQSINSSKNSLFDYTPQSTGLAIDIASESAFIPPHQSETTNFTPLPDPSYSSSFLSQPNIDSNFNPSPNYTSNYYRDPYNVAAGSQYTMATEIPANLSTYSYPQPNIQTLGPVGNHANNPSMVDMHQNLSNLGAHNDSRRQSTCSNASSLAYSTPLGSLTPTTPTSLQTSQWMPSTLGSSGFHISSMPPQLSAAQYHFGIPKMESEYSSVNPLYNLPGPIRRTKSQSAASAHGSTAPTPRSAPETPLSPASAEARISHTLAERRRRKEMKDLFDELREIVPTAKTARASKHETLVLSISYIKQLIESHRKLEEENQNLQLHVRNTNSMLESIKQPCPMLPRWYHSNVTNSHTVPAPPGGGSTPVGRDYQPQNGRRQSGA